MQKNEVRGSALAHARRDSGFAERVGSAAKSAKPPGGGRAAMLRFEADANSAKRPAAMLRFEAER